jgi:hypothetical protein
MTEDMAGEIIEAFAKALIEEVRDPAIEECDRNLRDQSALGRHWRETAARMTTEEALHELLPDVVDATIEQLLYALDDGRISLYFGDEGAARQELVDLGNGELLGWYANESEWLTRYSKRRFHNYTAQGPRAEDIPIPDDLLR